MLKSNAWKDTCQFYCNKLILESGSSVFVKRMEFPD